MSRAIFRAWHWNESVFALFRRGVPLTDRGFRYGQHVFESIAVRNRKPLLFPAHLSLLALSAKRKKIPFSRPLASALREFAGGVALRDGMLRIYLTAGSGSPASKVLAPACYVTWEASCFPGPSEISKGMKLITLGKPFPGDGWGEKCGNYEAHLLALAAARDSGADEAIVLGAGGRVLSCAMGNLLIWLPGKSAIGLCTPPTTGGARPGTVLGWVKNHVRVDERDLRGTDLRSAVAMAVTNSRLGVMPVASVDGRKLPHQSLALALARDYLRSHDLLRNA